MTTRSSWLLLLMIACGRTDHHTGVATSGGASSGGAGSPSAGAPGEETGAPENCLYPVKGLEISPTGNGDAATLGISRPFDIHVAPANWDGLAATLDLNGDLVSDLIYLDNSAASPRFRLAMTAPPPNVFDFWERDCASLQKLPTGRLFLRDLDGDSVPDFVVATQFGVEAFLNQRSGLKQVLKYGFPSPTWRVSVINVGVVDLNGDARSDLVIGFNRAESETGLALEMGARSFMQEADGELIVGQEYTAQYGVSRPITGYDYPGYFAVGRFGKDERASVALVNAARDHGFTIGVQASFDGTPPTPITLPELAEPIFELFSLPLSDGHAHLLATGLTNYYVLDLSQTPPVLVTKQPLAIDGGFSHEGGGGPEKPRYFVYDYDHDGDADFFEPLQGSFELLVHTNLKDSSFAPLQAVAVLVSGDAEDPFIEVGPGSGIVGQSSDDQGSAVYTLLGIGSAPSK